MNIWVILLSAAGGAFISEWYHARMWNRYKEGKEEGLKHREEVNKARERAYYK